VDHLLSYCSVANEVWSFVFRSFGVPLCLMWTVWWERNRRTFEDMESFVSQIIEVFAIFI
jgi:hypothetical protein